MVQIIASILDYIYIGLTKRKLCQVYGFDLSHTREDSYKEGMRKL